MTGMEYIHFIADLHGTPLEVRQERIDRMQEFLKLGEKINALIGTYSHGMRQKVCIMAALVHNPKLWLLDEPLTGLDPQTAKALRDYMQLYKKRGTRCCTARITSTQWKKRVTELTSSTTEN